MKAKEICQIIRACGKAGVKQFKHGDIELNFHEPERTYYLQDGVLTTKPPKTESPQKPTSYPTHPDAATIAAQADENDQLQVSFEQEARDLLEDPVAFEERIMQEQMTSDRAS